MSEFSSISCSVQHPFTRGTEPTHCVSIEGQTGQSVFWLIKFGPSKYSSIRGNAGQFYIAYWFVPLWVQFLYLFYKVAALWCSAYTEHTEILPTSFFKIYQIEFIWKFHTPFLQDPFQYFRPVCTSQCSCPLTFLVQIFFFTLLPRSPCWFFLLKQHGNL